MPLKPNNNAPTLRRAITTPRLKRSGAVGPGAQPGPMQQAGQPGLVGGPPQTGSPLGAQPQRTGLGSPMQQAGNPGLASGPRPQGPLQAGGQVRPSTQVRQGGQARTSAGAEPRYAYSSNTAMAKSRSFGDVIPSENRAAAEAMRADFQRSNQLRPGGVGMNVQREAPVMRRAASADGTPPVASTSSGLKSGGGEKQGGPPQQRVDRDVRPEDTEYDPGDPSTWTDQEKLEWYAENVSTEDANWIREWNESGNRPINSKEDLLELLRLRPDVANSILQNRFDKAWTMMRGADPSAMNEQQREMMNNLPAGWRVDEQGNVYAGGMGSGDYKQNLLGNIFDPATGTKQFQSWASGFMPEPENPADSVTSAFDGIEDDLNASIDDGLDAARVQRAMQKAQAHRALMERASRSGMSPTQLTGQLGQIAQSAAADNFSAESQAEIQRAQMNLQVRMQEQQQKYNLARMKYEQALHQGNMALAQQFGQEAARLQSVMAKDMMEFEWRMNQRISGADIAGGLLGPMTSMAGMGLGTLIGGPMGGMIGSGIGGQVG